MFNPFQFHHLYWGIIVAIVGLLLRKKSRTWSYILVMVGVAVATDDVLEHFVFGGWSAMSALFHHLWGAVFGNWWLFGTL